MGASTLVVMAFLLGRDGSLALAALQLSQFPDHVLEAKLGASGRSDVPNVV